MPFTILSNKLATGGAVTLSAQTALTDPEFTQQSSSYIFTEPYDLRAVASTGATVTELAISAPTWNAVGKLSVWPLMQSLTIPSPAQIAWLYQQPTRIPMMEQVQFQVSDTASETTQSFFWITPANWTPNLPAGKIMMPVKFTASPVITANAWSAAVSITLAQTLRGGVYSVVNAKLFAAGVTAFRLIAPRQQMYHGRKLRPGDLATQATGNVEDAFSQVNPFRWGEWLRFHTFELPQLEVTGTSGSPSAIGYLWLIYLGESQSILDQWAGAGTPQATQSGIAL